MKKYLLRLSHFSAPTLQKHVCEVYIQRGGRIYHCTLSSVILLVHLGYLFSII